MKDKKTKTFLEKIKPVRSTAGKGLKLGTKIETPKVKYSRKNNKTFEYE